MGDLPQCLQIWGRRLGRVGKNKLILLNLILILGMGLFFYSFSEASAEADSKVIPQEILPEVIDPLNKIGKGIVIENKQENKKKSSVISHQLEKIALPESLANNAVEEIKKEGEGVNSLENTILALVAGYPIEKMAKAISKQDGTVASFLVAIAKKESSWGEHTPKKNGQECYNYWGYKGGINPTEGGYSCFESPEQAVEIVGARLQKLVDQGINTAEKMLVWKCGSSCATHNPQDVRKWVADVDLYYGKMEKL